MKKGKKKKVLKLWLYRHDRDNDFHLAVQYPFWATYPSVHPHTEIRYWSDFKPIEVKMEAL